MQRARELVGQALATLRWCRTGFGPPYPHYMKQATLLRHSVPNSLVIESGTYRGSTSRYFRRHGFEVVTIEVHRPLYDRYSPGLKRRGIDARFGDSALELPLVLEAHKGVEALTVFLDGHYSGGATGMGLEPVPAVKEFEAIALFCQAHREAAVTVMVDDFRLFMPGGDPSYPTKQVLMDFNSTIGGEWSVENDIYIAQRDAQTIDTSNLAQV